MFPTLALLAASPSIVVHFEDTGELAPDNQSRLIAAIQDALQHQKRSVEMDRDVSRCGPRPQQCLSEVRGRMGEKPALFAIAFSGATRIRVSIRAYVENRQPIAGEVDLSLTDHDWAGRFLPLARAFTEEISKVASRAQRQAVVAEHRQWIPHVLLLGTAVVAGGISLGFGLSHRAALNELETSPPSSPEIPGLIRRARTQGALSNGFLFASLGVVVVGAVWLFIDTL